MSHSTQREGEREGHPIILNGQGQSYKYAGVIGYSIQLKRSRDPSLFYCFCICNYLRHISRKKQHCPLLQNNNMSDEPQHSETGRGAHLQILMYHLSQFFTVFTWN